MQPVRGALQSKKYQFSSIFKCHSHWLNRFQQQECLSRPTLSNQMCSHDCNFTIWHTHDGALSYDLPRFIYLSVIWHLHDSPSNCFDRHNANLCVLHQFFQRPGHDCDIILSAINKYCSIYQVFGLLIKRLDQTKYSSLWFIDNKQLPFRSPLPFSTSIATMIMIFKYTTFALASFLSVHQPSLASWHNIINNQLSTPCREHYVFNTFGTKHSKTKL